MERARNISKSMISYLKRVKEQKEFLVKETVQYESSKRHLANMMGLDDKEMTQADIDKAIKYLFPSGMFDHLSHPKLSHPNVLFKKVQEARFDETGRPVHYLFYTTQPIYNETMGKISDFFMDLDKFEDDQIRKGIVTPPENAKFNLGPRRWISDKEFAEKLNESVTLADYDYFIKSIEALLNHPYSAKAKDFFIDYSQEKPGVSLNILLPELKKDEQGRVYGEMITKKCEHQVETRVTFNGSGKVDIDGRDILYFDVIYRRNLFFPIQISGMQDKIDIKSRVVSDPPRLNIVAEAAISGAMREAVSRIIAAYVGPSIRERMRLAGLLTTDQRRKERKKPGQEGARRKFTWRKR